VTGASLTSTFRGSEAVALNGVRHELAALDADTPAYRLRGLKREELSLMGSVVLHELYFANLFGFHRAAPNSGLGRPDWHEVPDALAAEIGADFGSASAWCRDFVGTAQSLAGGSGWVLRSGPWHAAGRAARDERCALPGVDPATSSACA
jgi:superoxide dismutase